VRQCCPAADRRRSTRSWVGARARLHCGFSDSEPPPGEVRSGPLDRHLHNRRHGRPQLAWRASPRASTWEGTSCCSTVVHSVFVNVIPTRARSRDQHDEGQRGVSVRSPTGVSASRAAGNACSGVQCDALSSAASPGASSRRRRSRGRTGRSRAERSDRAPAHRRDRPRSRGRRCRCRRPRRR
jgi:hypothetical protein